MFAKLRSALRHNIIASIRYVRTSIVIGPCLQLLCSITSRAVVLIVVCSDLQMLFVTDVLCMIPVPTTINDVIQTFKFDSLYVLFDSVTELQLARELPSDVTVLSAGVVCGL